MSMRFRPVSEILMEAIRFWCSLYCSSDNPNDEDILLLFNKIKDTKITEGHDQVIAALDYYFDFHGAEKFSSNIQEVKEYLLAQKTEMGKKS